MKAKRMTVFLGLVCAFCLMIGLVGCGSSSDGGMLGPPDDTVDIGQVSDDLGGGDGDDEANDDETSP